MTQITPTNNLVSIVIPYFNCYKYIEECLESVFSQTHSPIQIIVVNDGSDEKNTQFLQSYLKEHPVITYLYQDNKGVASARNTGAKYAKGEFLLFLDADDKLAPTFVEKTLTYLLQNPECKAVYSRAAFFDAQDKEWILPDYKDFRDLLISNKIPAMALHKRKDFLALDGFDINLSYYEDWDYWIRILKNGGYAKKIDELLFFYRKRKDSSSLTDCLINNPQKNRQSWQIVCQKHTNIYIENNLSYMDFFDTISKLENQEIINKDLLDVNDNLKENNKKIILDIEFLKSNNKSLNDDIKKLNSNIIELSNFNKNLSDWNAALSTHNQVLENKLHKLKKLWLIKLLKPFIKIEEGLHSLNRYRKQFRKLSKNKGGFQHSYHFLKNMSDTHGFKQARNFLKYYDPNSTTHYLSSVAPIDKNRKFHIDDKITLVCTKHTHYIAKLLKESFGRIGVDCDIIFDMPNTGYTDDWHIVICPQMFDVLPNYYLAFQLEQSVSSRWFNEAYFERLNNAKYVFDYSLKNIEFLHKNNLPFSNIFYLPIDILHDNQDKAISLDDFEYDVAFYGDPNCERRQLFLKKLQEKFSVKVISEVFGDELHVLLKKAKIIVNIHYYENALLETTRLYECLSLNKIIVSEKGSDQAEHTDLEDIISFVEVGNIDEMITSIQLLLDNKEIIEQRLELIKQRKQNTDKFQFYLYRFLLAQDLLDFEKFYELVADYVKPQGDFWCLSLPESTQRRADFQKDNQHGIWLFDGLRHHIGWIGCGLSYKFMMKLAHDLKIPKVTICEDDVLFDNDFNERYQTIKKDLAHNNNWDIFSGLIADLSKDIKLLHSDIKSEKESYYKINKLVSMVFNIYNQSIYNKIYQWDYHNRNTNNTIDRYLENLGEITGIITDRFLIGHKEELSSTLWGFQNTQYSQMIKDSQSLLTQKIYELNKETDKNEENP